MVGADSATLRQQQPKISILFTKRESSHSVVANALYCSLEVSEFEFQLRYYVHFWTNTFQKSMDLLILLPSYGLNSITAVFFF